jgi:mersacidin/lichenicidin family type 2 lantibiotic
MKALDIIRAWKDPEYRATLNEAELAALPAHPSGQVELSDNDLGGVAAGEEASTEGLRTYGCCTNTFYMPCTIGTYYIPLFSLGCCYRDVA